MVKIEVSEFEEIWTDETVSVMINESFVSKNNFVPHENSYIDAVIKSIKKWA